VGAVRAVESGQSRRLAVCHPPEAGLRRRVQAGQHILQDLAGQGIVLCQIWQICQICQICSQVFALRFLLGACEGDAA
jgi:hypothetical protein